MSGIYAGVDLGGTNIKAVIACSSGEILAESNTPTLAHEGPQKVLDRIAAIVEELARQAGHPPQAVGMGCPGLVDVEKGFTRFFPNLPTQWRDVPVAAVLGQKLGCPVRLLNDVRCATLGEQSFGQGRDVATMVFFAVGTGIGGGVIVDGKLRLGPLGAAGELGHQTVLPDGPLCGCGNHGCLEALASATAIAAEGLRLMRGGMASALFQRIQGDANQITPRVMAEVADQDPAVRDVLVRAARWLGIGVANAVTILHPELVVLGGGVAEMGDLLLDEVRAVVRKRVGMFPTDDVRMERSQLGEQAGVLGAIAWAAKGI